MNCKRKTGENLFFVSNFPILVPKKTFFLSVHFTYLCTKYARDEHKRKRS